MIKKRFSEWTLQMKWPLLGNSYLKICIVGKSVIYPKQSCGGIVCNNDIHCIMSMWPQDHNNSSQRQTPWQPMDGKTPPWGICKHKRCCCTGSLLRLTYICFYPLSLLITINRAHSAYCLHIQQNIGCKL